MAKFSLGDGGLKGFMAQHGEKFAFGIVLLGAFYLVYSGTNVEGYDKAPKELKDLAQRASTYVNTNEPQWLDGDVERNPYSNYPERADQGRIEISDLFYALEMPLNPILKPQTEKRSDPAIYPPVQMEVSAIGRVAVALPTRRGQKDAFANDKSASAKEETRKPRRRRRKNDDGGKLAPPGEGGAGGLGAGGLGAGGLGAGGLGAGGLGAGGLGDENDAADDGNDAAASGTDLAIPGEEETYTGPDPGGWDSSMAGADGRGAAVGGAGAGLYSYSVNVIAVRALIPYEKQWSEYERVFVGAANYDQIRDIPNYMAFSAERAEVGADPKAPLKWERVWSTKDALNRLKVFPGTMTDVVDASFALPNTTMRIPPIMLANVRDHVSHSGLPKLVQTETKDDEKEDTSDPNSPFGDVGGSDLPTGDIPGPGSAPGSGGLGAPGAGGADPAGGGLGASGLGAGGLGAPGAGAGVGGLNAGGLGAGGMGGIGSGGMGAVAKKTKSTKYKLIRFFDFKVEPGKKYRYRVQLLVEDPNHPQDPKSEPPMRTLMSKVLTRLKTVADEERKSKSRKFFLRTDWSEPSEVVSVPYPQRVLPGLVTVPTGQAANREIGVDIEVRETSAKVVGVTWDKDRAVDVPIEVDVARGAVVNLKKDAIVVHPVTKAMKLLEDYDVITNTVVLDYRGGQKIGGGRDDPMKAPTEMLMLSATGELVVRSEIDDTDEYRWLTRVDKGTGSRPGAGAGNSGAGGLGAGGLGGGLGAGGGGAAPAGYPGPPGGKN